ncbi:MAG: MBL fold metallo-hydrolase [Candidatus Lokiarchaeota archaeon]|nr:MBL fold metallo-hydrolase [Candidatus Lokiarchaeota archaeon]
MSKGYLSVKTYNEHDNKVEIIKMGRQIFGKLIYPCFTYKIGKILIDTGSMMAERELISYLENDPPEFILITHGDEDHTGNLKKIQKSFDVDTYSHSGAIEYIEHPEKLKLLWYQRFVWGIPKPTTSSPIELGKTYKFDDKKIIPISTPGHRKHHLSFYLPDLKWVFTGDIYCGRRVKTYFPYENFYEILSSIEKLKELELSKLFCAFRGMTDSPNQKLSEKFEYMCNLKDKVINLADDGFTLKQISRKIFGRERLISLITSGDMKHKHLISSILLDRK